MMQDVTYLEAISELVLATDPSGAVTYANHRWCHFTGQRPAEVMGLGFLEAVHRDHRPALSTMWSAMREARAPMHAAYRLCDAHGDARWFVMNAVPMYDSGGTVDCWLCTWSNIEQEKQFEEAQMQQAAQMRDDFLSIASHELRTPLTSLMLQADGLGRSLRRDQPLSRDAVAIKVGRILKQSERLARLIENLLDATHAQRESMVLEVSDVDPMDVLRGVARRFAPEALHSGCELRLHGPAPMLPERLDRGRLEQVVGNLVDNALRYGRGKPVDLSVGPTERGVVFEVRDQGIGIASVDHARIFGRFERATSDRHYGGLGLGLWVARHIIDAMGGTLSVQSTPGAGATFTVALPSSGGSANH